MKPIKIVRLASMSNASHHVEATDLDMVRFMCLEFEVEPGVVIRVTQHADGTLRITTPGAESLVMEPIASNVILVGVRHLGRTS